MQASASAAQHDLDNRGLIGVVVSGNLYRGDDMGYCLMVTRDTIIGAKKPPSLSDFEAYLGPGSKIADAARVEANKIAEHLVGVREFSVSAGSIDQILLKRPGLFFGGYVIIRTRRGSFRTDMRLLSIGGLDLLEASNILADSLGMVVGERFRIMGNGLPVTMGWPWTRPGYSNSEDQLYNALRRDEHLRTMLAMLEKREDGLSNAEIDTALSNYSQWTTIRHLRELMAMGLIEYKPELFGNPGKYLITDLGVSTLRKLAS
jgi:hypothetical protein